LTPKKFQSLHSFVGLSHGISIAKDTSVTIQNIQVSDKTRRIYQTYPGPLVRQTSHKKTVIEFCEEKLNLRNQNKPFEASYSLIWSFLILIIRQNGNYTEGDISELLMKNSEEFKTTLEKPQETGSGKQTPEEVEESENEIESNEVSTANSIVSEELVIHKFREYLLYGNVGDALDFATDNNLWGHALFLASKVDKRQHANVMLKFANKLPYNDPLQTLYQIMSGRTPACVTNLDDKWGDWRPHLAMIISNSKEKPELVKKSIIQLGDHLLNRGDIFGSHFCYLIAEPIFGEYTSVDSKIVLIGATHTQNFKDFSSDDAIMMTEIFEYARSLSDANFNIVSLAKFKFLLASRMLDYGFQLKALLYMEEIARQIIKQPQNFDSDFITRVYSLADRLKFYDPVLAKSYEDNYNNNEWETAENQKWLQDLSEIVNMGHYNQQSVQSSPQFSQYDHVNQQVQNSTSVDEYGYDPVAQYQQQLTPVHQVSSQEMTPNHSSYQNEPMIPTQNIQNNMNYQNLDNNYSYEYHQPTLNPEQSQDQPDINDQSNISNNQYNYYDYSNTVSLNIESSSQLNNLNLEFTIEPISKSTNNYAWKYNDK
jgi:COPII coat assembly protein SEC16